MLRRDGGFADPTPDGPNDAADGGSEENWGARFDRLELLIEGIDGAVGENYQRSLVALRDRAEAAEATIVRTLLRPMGLKLALTIDSIDRFLADNARQEPADSAAASVDFIRHVAEELIDTLDEFGVEEVPADTGASIDRTAHRVVAPPEGGGSPGRQLVIEHRERRGYRIDDRVIRNADVTARYE